VWVTVRFLNVRNWPHTSGRHPSCRICEVYGENATSGSMVKRRVWLFDEGRTNVHDEQLTGRPSLVDDGLVRDVEGNLKKTGDSQLRPISIEFSRISRSLLHGILSKKTWIFENCVHRINDEACLAAVLFSSTIMPVRPYSIWILAGNSSIIRHLNSPDLAIFIFLITREIIPWWSKLDHGGRVERSRWHAVAITGGVFLRQ